MPSTTCWQKAPDGQGAPSGIGSISSAEEQLRDMQAMLQRTVATVADMARMMHPGTGVPDDSAPTGEDSKDVKGHDGK